MLEPHCCNTWTGEPRQMITTKQTPPPSPGATAAYFEGANPFGNLAGATKTPRPFASPATYDPRADLPCYPAINTFEDLARAMNKEFEHMRSSHTQLQEDVEQRLEKIQSCLDGVLRGGVQQHLEKIQSDLHGVVEMINKGAVRPSCGDPRFAPRSPSKSVERSATLGSEAGTEVVNESPHDDKMKQYISPEKGQKPKKKSVMGAPVVSAHSSLVRHSRNRNLRGIASNLLKRKEVELTIVAFIMMNSLVMCFEAQYQGFNVGKDLEYPGYTRPAPDIWPGASTAFNILDWVFGIFFTAEMVMKLTCWQYRYFYDCKDLNLKEYKCKSLGLLHGVQAWNWLDFFCVVAFFSDKLAAKSGINPQILRLLRLLRLWRLVRLVRFLEMVDHLYVMVTAINSLGKVLSWAVLLLTAVLMACDLVLVQSLQVSYFNKVVANDLTDDQLRKHQKMYEYFGTCSRGMLSMFEITMGNWPPIARLLSEEVSEWFTLICLIHKVTVGFAMIGVITAIILQETFKVAQTDDLIMFRQKQRASRVLRAKMKKLFDVLDDSGDGQLALDEFRTIGDFPEIKTWLSSLDIETDDLDCLFALIDVEGKDYVTLDELVGRIPRIKGTARSIDLLTLRKQLDS